MIHFRNYSSLFLVAASIAACSGSGSAVGPQPAPDEPAVVDGDPGDPSDDPARDDDDPKENVSEVDTDGDGLATDRDLCPGSAEGEEVDGNGCSQSQRDAAGDTQEEPAGGDKPKPDNGAGEDDDWSPEDDGKAAPNGFATFVLDPGGPNPITLKTLAENVDATENGFHVEGTLLIQVPGGEQIALLQADLTLEYDGDPARGLQRVNGSASVPFPALGAFSGAELEEPVHASLGYDLGDNIEAEGPLAGDRKYLFFTFSSGLNAGVGELEISAGSGQSVTMALDPNDPAFFLRASLDGSLGPINDAGVGFSAGGHLLFEPENTWGLDAAEEIGFEGHVWITGEVDLNDLGLPLALAGETAYDLDPNDDGETLFDDPAGGFQIGSNSELALSIDAGLIGLSLPIAEGSVVGHIGDGQGKVSFSGYVAAGNAWMPDEVPVENTQRLNAAGVVSTDLSESYFSAEGALRFDAETLGDWAGLDLSALAVAKATLDIDRDGVLVRGLASTSLTPLVGLKGDVAVEAFFNGDPGEWYLTLDGRLEVKGVDLSSNARAVLDKDGLFVSGAFKTPLARIALSGNITKAGVDLRGEASVAIPIVAGKEIVQIVTDAAVCGTEFVADAALCGTDFVQNGAVCGTEYVTDAVVCGTEPVRDAAICGKEWVTSGAECGTQVVTDGARCGWNHLSGWAACGAQCVGSLFSDCDCWEARSCTVDASCEVPRTCDIAATCEIDASCDVPRVCERTLTCENRVTIPDFDYGNFEGKLSVTIGNSGLGGTVSGEYCTTDGSCTTLGGGRLELSSGKPEACISIGGLGEFCAPI